MKRIGLIFLFCIVTTAVCFALMRYFVELRGINMSIHGEIAMGLGVFFTTLVGAALMALTFHSSRAGHDAEVHSFTPTSDDSVSQSGIWGAGSIPLETQPPREETSTTDAADEGDKPGTHQHEPGKH